MHEKLLRLCFFAERCVILEVNKIRQPPGCSKGVNEIMKEYAFGIDLGGTTAKIGLFTTAGALLEKWEVPTDTSNAGEHILENLAAAIMGKMQEKAIPAEQVEGVGIGVPGPVLDSSVVPVICANLGGWGQRNVSAQLSGLLDGIKVRLNTDYLEHKSELDALADKVVYTGPIDAYFDYKLGTLEYRSVRFETELLDQPNFQGNAAVNYTDRETQWTRIIEHKWFEFGKDENGNDLPKTIISREYSSEWKPGDEPYYPVNDAKNSLLYSEYKKLADAENKVIFGGRLGEYKYYDMDQVIAAVLEKCEKEFVGENV